MLKKFNYLLIALASVFALSSCIKEKVEVPSAPTITIDPSGSVDDSNKDDGSKTDNNNDNTDDPNAVLFTVQLTYNDKPLEITDEDSDIYVIWENETSVYQEKIDKNGKAVAKNLDGDFFVHLSKMPEKYTYNPNLDDYYVSQDNPNCEIKLKRVNKPRASNNNDLYNAINIRTEGFYRCSIPRKNKIIYYEFTPKKAGTYVFESLVDCRLDIINPIAFIHKGQSEWKPTKPTKVVDTGGREYNNGFTKNFKMVFSEDAGNSFTFGIKVESANDEYPAFVDFVIINAADYEQVDPIVGLGQVAHELDKAKITMDTTGMKLVNSDGGIGNYYEKPFPRNTILDGSKFKYKEDEGIYYYYDPVNDKYITPLCAYITSPCPYYPNEPLGALATIQSNGNKALTVRDENKNYYDYSTFIESQYASIANEQGLVYVTKELKDFLQMFSTSQRLFMDGNGFIEDQFGIMAKGPDQWLFACCYYVNE